MWPVFDSRTRLWVEFVVVSRPFSGRFFFGYSAQQPPKNVKDLLSQAIINDLTNNEQEID